MIVKTRAKQLLALGIHPNTFTCRSQYIFILSHMRSRSSLLSHILGSHPKICGYVEQHNAYSGWLNLMKLRADIYLDTKDNLEDKYLLDKILHNPLEVSEAILTKENVKIIFLIRQPERTFKSIIRNCQKANVPDWRTQQQVLEYYTQRLQQLESYSTIVKENALFIESDQLINSTESVLEKISNWLNLETKLDQNYSVFDKTGLPGYGDPLGNIKSGKIVNTQEPSGISIDQAYLEEGQAVYDACYQTLTRNCSSVL